MGLVLDSSVLIDAERSRGSISDVLRRLAAVHGEVDVVLSAVSVMELEHGYYRATSPKIAARLRAFLNEVYAVLDVLPLSGEAARLAAQIDAELREAGTPVPLADRLIAATALSVNFGVATGNVRHFGMIPRLSVNEF